MRPTEGSNSTVLEMGISPLDFFQDLSVLLVDGRLPESKSGRKAGFHSWPLTKDSKKACCFSAEKNFLCNLVSEARTKVKSCFNSNVQLLSLDVLCKHVSNKPPQERIEIDINNKKEDNMLLEHWQISIIKKNDSTANYANANMVFQAVRSFLHFSQLSAWWSKSNGCTPSNIVFRISTSCANRNFLHEPILHLFPKMEISKTSYIQISVNSLPRVEIENLTFKDCRNVDLVTKSSLISQNSWNTSHALQEEGNVLNLHSGKRKDENIDLYYLTHCRATSCQTTNHSGEKHLKLDPELTNDWSDSNNPPSNVMKGKGLADLLQNFDIGSEVEFPETNEQCLCPSFANDAQGTSSGVRPMRSKSVSPYFSARYQNLLQNSSKVQPIAARRLIMGGATTPVFHSKTGLPLSSSPAPVKKDRISADGHFIDDNTLSQSNSPEDFISYGLSKSAPASTNLLGNFEESILKGRMPVYGTLEGFRVQLGASGSFYSKHVTLPVKVQYFQICEDKYTPSPYLGYISLKDKVLNGRRYRVPSKGTIQLTVFNPNDTVVKVFVVLYNYEDMLALSRTFLRQRILSSRKDPKTLEEIQTLHYLVHLSFVSSKRSRIYLHTEIQILFPQQTPDGRLFTITDGPSNPKYTPLLRADCKV